MLKKLNSALKSPESQSAFKALIFSAIFLFAANRVLWLVILAVLGFYFYSRPFLIAKRFLFSFLIFLTIVFSAAGRLPVVLEWQNFFAAAVFGLIFFLFLEIKNPALVYRKAVCGFINNFLFLSVLLIFFSSESSGLFALKFLIVVVAIFLLFREFLALKKSENPEFFILNKADLFAAALAFLFSQFILALNYLPIGFLNASALALTAVLLLKDLAKAHLSGYLNRRIVLKNATIFIIFCLIVFATSKWQP